MRRDNSTIRGQFSGDDARRQATLEIARDCAALTKPGLLPPTGQTPNTRLPESFQSTGSRGLTNLEGRMLLALFPPGSPWFKFALAANVQHDPSVDDATKQTIADLLLLRELQIMATLESTRLRVGHGEHRPSFRSQKRKAISQILATGDALEYLDSNYQLRVYGRTQYVTRRNSSGEVLYHITREKIDPLTLTPEQRNTVNLEQSVYEARNADDRMKDLYTKVEWHPDSRVWVIEQELNEHVFNESEEKISPFFSTPYELCPEEDYGRGFIELNLPDLRSHNELREKMLDYAAIASKMITAIDTGSMVRETDMAKPSGSVIRARVSAGQIQDVAMLRADKMADFSVVHSVNEVIRKDLGMAMLIESEVTPSGDRVTALQVQRVAIELEGALGGVYSSIADQQQIPLLQRVVYQMQRDNLMPPLPDDAVEINALTGISALSREISAGRVSSFVATLAQLGPETMARINMNVLVDALARYHTFYEPGLIKTEEQLKQEQAAAMRAQIQAAIAQQAIQSTGKVAETAAAQATAPPTENPNG